MLIDAARMLALEAEAQVRAFPPFVVVADELALNFSNAYLLIDEIVEEGLLDTEQMRSFQQIEDALRSLTDVGDQEAWTLDALALREEWHAIRSQARAALTALGLDPENLSIPALSGITYVERGSR